MNNRRGVSRALLAAPLLTAAFAVVAAGLPAAASAATAQSAASAATAHSADSVPRTLLATPAGSPLTSIVAAGAVAGPGSAVLGSITGIVRGATGAGLAGVCVTATGPAAGSALAGPAAAHHVVTTAGGQYVVGNLRLGAYTVGYSDCAQPGRYLDQSYGETGLAAGPARVTVTAGHPALLNPVTLRLASPLAEVAASRRAQALARAAETPRAKAGQAAARQDVISGTARTKSGRALAGICAFAQTSTANSFSGFGVQTGRHGGYQLPIGTSGKYQVEFFGGCGNGGNFAPQWWRYTPTERKATNLHARPGRNFRGINAALLPGAEITGTVRAASSGKPLKGVCVDALGGSEPFGLGLPVQAATQANGTYVLKNLGTGRYRIQFSPGCGLRGNYLSSNYPRPVSARGGKTVRGINGSLRLGGEISGVVTSQATGAALSGICVNVQTANGNSFFSAVSGKTGTYSVGHLPGGRRYEVQFQPGCGNSGSYQTEYYRGAVNPAAATLVAVTGGKVQSGIDEALLAGGTVSGQVTNQAGAPIPGVCVQVSSQNDLGGLGRGPFLALEAEVSITFDQVTGPKGGFSVPDLVPGLYSVKFSGGCGDGSDIYAGHAFTPQGGQGPGWVSVRGGLVTSGVSAVLRRGGSIAGVVTGRSGQRLSGNCVSAVPAGTPATTPALFTNTVPTSHGSYRIPGLSAGKYAVQFGSCFFSGAPYASQWYKNKRTRGTATLVTVRTGHTTAGISARLVSGGTITGRVLSAVTGKPVANACVFLETSGGAFANAAATSKTGQYKLTHVAAGRWVVDPSLCESQSPALAGLTRPGVMVRNGSATTASFRLPAAGRISGTVSGGTPTAAQAGVCVEATPITGPGQANSTVTNAQGHYTLPGLAAGRYRVLLTSLCAAGTAALVPQWFNGQPTSGTATPVRVTAGKTTLGIDGSLVADGGISGRVTGSSAAAVAGVCVGAYAGTSATPAAVAITGVAGGYQLLNLPPGRYVIEFSSGCGAASYATQWFSGATARSGATPVNVTAGLVTGDIDAG